jgi:Icc-related predicted phosphoesterase
MRIVGLTDLHGETEGLLGIGEIRGADLVLIAGDLTHFGHAAEAARVVDAIRDINPEILAVPGNCDFPDAAEWLAEQGLSLHGRCLERDGVAFLGLGGSLPCPGTTPLEFGEAELATFLDEATSELDPGTSTVFLTHQPPSETAVDRIHSGAHVGSSSVRRFIEERQPLVCLTGHIHEARGVDTISETRIINPGPARRGGYALIEIEDTTLARAELRT